MYYYKLYYDGSLLYDSSDENKYYERKGESSAKAETKMRWYIHLWTTDGEWHEFDNVEYFDIEICEM